MPNVNLITGGDTSNTLSGTAGNDLIYGFNPNGPQSQASSILATRVASGLTQPVFVGAPPGDTGHLFIVERTGQIKILDLASGQVLATPFLDVSSEILTDGERGLLGLAFDPDFATNGFFYVNMINLNGDTAIRRYHASPNANVADPASATLIIAIDQPNDVGFTNHKAGWLGFGPDGYLYAALGDGGSAGDPKGNGQDINSLLGKILRLDVSGVPDGLPPDPLHPHYAVPADNPFVNQPGADEIFAYGLRNPWRDSFDRATGDFYIADVGQNVWEEIDIGQIGANYGWNVREGPDPYSGGTATGPVVDPIYSYNHSVGQITGQSITGGYVYRGEGEALQGQYFFADFVQGKVFTLRFDGSAWVATDRTAQIATDFGPINNPSSFGEDARGNLYIVKFDYFNDGAIFRLTPMGASADQGDVLRGLGGDDMLFGGSGNDTLEGGPGGDTLIGGPGIDTADYSSSPAGVSVNLQTGLGSGGDAQGDILTGIEDLIGSPQADILIGDSGANKLEGRSGNDILDGGPGMDTAVYSGTHSQYQITQNSNGSVHIVDLRGGVPDGVDDVSNVELFQFADGTINVAPVFELNAFGVNAGGWSSDDTYPRELADVDSDGRADIIGFGHAGVWVSLATAGGHFAAPTFELNAFGVNAGGWSSNDTYPRELADVDGDGRADIVGFGNAGVWVSLATAGGHFAAPTFELNAFGVNAGVWSSDNTYPRELADVDGDGRADIVGFGNAGVWVSLATAGGHFAAPTFELNAFGVNAGGWSSDNTYPRELADVDGDGRADIIGFGNAGVWVSLATAGGHFAAPTFELNAFGVNAGGWSSDNTYPRELADLNGDGRADIVGFGNAGLWVSLATAGGHFAAPTFELNAFGVNAGGWSSQDSYPRELADVNGDVRADIVGFGHAGVYVVSEFLVV